MEIRALLSAMWRTRTGRLTDATLSALIAVRPTQRAVSDFSVPGLSIRLGGQGATWTLVLRVAGEGGISRRGRRACHI